MIDTHCHCLYGVDDAALDIETSIAMLQEAYEGGITKVLCTSHSLPGGKYSNDFSILNKVFLEIQEAIEMHQIPIEIYLGSEVYYLGDVLEWAKADRIVTLNHTNRILLEFPWHDEDINFDPIPAVKNMLAFGYRIIIAHPERYPFIHKDYSYMQVLRDLGCNFQVNRTSLVFTDDRQYDFVWRIVEDGFADVIATDAHRPNSRRSITLQDAWDIIEKRYGIEEAQRLLIGNPQALIDGTELKIK